MNIFFLLTTLLLTTTGRCQSLANDPNTEVQQTVSDLGQRVNTIEQILNNRFEWAGELETTYESNQRPAARQSSKQEAAIRAHLRPKLDLNKKYSLNLDILFRADARNTERNTVRLDEAYLRATLPGLNGVTLRAGKMMYNWGVDALFNPTDYLNPVDYYDFYHLDKLGVLAIDVNYAATNELSITAGVIPIFQPNIVSNPNSRWINYSKFISRAVLSSIALPSALPSDYYIEFDLKQRSPEFPQPFLRTTYKTIDFDFSASYSYRYNPAPQVITLSSDIGFDAINSFPTGKLEGTPYYQQEHLLAIDTSIPVFGAILFMGSALHLPASSQKDLPTSTQILSNYNSAGFTGISQADIESSRLTTMYSGTVGFRKEWTWLTAYIQYARLWYIKGAPPASLFNKVGQSTGVNPSDVFDFFSGSIIPAVKWKLAKRVWLLGGSVINLKRTGTLVNLGAEYEFADGFKIAANYNYIRGKTGSLLEHYEDNSRFGLNLNMVF